MSIIADALDLFKENSILAGNLCAAFQVRGIGTFKPYRGSRNADRLRMTAVTACGAVLI